MAFRKRSLIGPAPLSIRSVHLGDPFIFVFGPFRRLPVPADLFPVFHRGGSGSTVPVKGFGTGRVADPKRCQPWGGHGVGSRFRAGKNMWKNTQSAAYIGRRKCDPSQDPAPKCSHKNNE